jgi:hypothetical protein
VSFPKEIAKFMADFGVNADEVWKIAQGNAYAVKHKALERVAAERGIATTSLKVLALDQEKGIAAVEAEVRHGDMQFRSFGEVSPKNNKNSYPLAMAEKRAVDRAILKALVVHGELYSEDEADDFKRPNPHVTRPEDIGQPTEYNEHGEPVDNIPHGDPSIDRLPKKDARKDYEAAQKEMRATQTLKQLETWAAANANRVQSYPADWAEIFRGLYADHRDDLRAKQQEAA